jgi:hypothetical protein
MSCLSALGLSDDFCEAAAMRPADRRVRLRPPFFQRHVVTVEILRNYGCQGWM